MDINKQLYIATRFHASPGTFISLLLKTFVPYFVIIIRKNMDNKKRYLVEFDYSSRDNLTFQTIFINGGLGL